MKPTTKIAVAGSYGTGKTMTSLALSRILDLPRAHVENIDSLYFKIYGKNKNPKEYSTAELLSLGLARFHSRIKQEDPGGFISDGSVFNEIAYGEARIAMSERKAGSFKGFLHKEIYKDYRRRLYRTITDYGRNAYNNLFYLRITPVPGGLSKNSIVFQEYFEKTLFRLFDENNIEYRVLEGSVETFIPEILSSLGFGLPEGYDLKQIINAVKTEKENFKTDYHYGKND